MKLAIVIVSYNTRDLLDACLRSVSACLPQSAELDADVWVVDNASADGSASLVRNRYPWVNLIASEENLGFSGGNNAALAACGLGPTDTQPSASLSFSATDHEANAGKRSPPDLVLLLNPDTEVIGEAIGHMARFLASYPRAGAAGARLQYPNGSFQHSAFAFPGLLQLWFDFFPPRPRRLLETRLNGRYPRRWYNEGKPFPVGFALGAALMVRREAIEVVGLLDEGYFMYAEEVDWCWRLARAGWPCFCVPVARFVHHAGASSRQFRQESILNLWRSRKRLYERFYGSVRRWLAFRLVRLGMRTEALRCRRSASRGEISEAELENRLATSRAVARLYAQG